MKRIITLAITALMLAMCLVSCGKRDPKYFGKWEGASMTLDGKTSDKVMGVPIAALFRFEIYDDGKVK